MPRPAVLIVAGASPMKAALADSLLQSGCLVYTAEDSLSGVEQAVEMQPDLVFVEQPLDDGDWLDFCQSVRHRLSSDQHPVFLVTPSGKPSEGDGEQLTQTSTLPSPVGVDRIARGVNTLLLWSKSSEQRGSKVSCNGLLIDDRSHRTTLDGRELSLTPTEYRLLWTLASRPGHVVSRAKLTEHCRDGGISTQQRTIDVHIKAIRQKLGDAAGMIETVRGIGYRMRDQQAVASESTS